VSTVSTVSPESRAPRLIAVDWGTTSCRLALLADDGTIIGRRDDGPGILAVPPGGFPAALDRFVHGLAAVDTPILLSGMVGSRQGWIEAPYVPCPAGLQALVDRLVPLDLGNGRRCAVVPGLSVETTWPDVMRGEETQVFGVLARSGAGAGQFVLPGTHAKWLSVRDGRIADFASYMTGEVYAALRGHTILARLMAVEAQPFAASAFARGVALGAAAGGPGALLNRVFSARTLALFDRLTPGEGADYLSGLLIGAEVAAATAETSAAAVVTIVGSDALTQRYAAALAGLGRAHIVAAPDAAAHGALAIARAAGWL
jgi:2-dehydro-3-deoxygalactonokinase